MNIINMLTLAMGTFTALATILAFVIDGFKTINPTYLCRSSDLPAATEKGLHKIKFTAPVWEDIEQLTIERLEKISFNTKMMNLYMNGDINIDEAVFLYVNTAPVRGIIRG
jgi:hypothetical protein